MEYMLSVIGYKYNLDILFQGLLNSQVTFLVKILLKVRLLSVILLININHVIAGLRNKKIQIRLDNYRTYTDKIFWSSSFPDWAMSERDLLISNMVGFLQKKKTKKKQKKPRFSLHNKFTIITSEFYVEKKSLHNEHFTDLTPQERP